MRIKEVNIRKTTASIEPSMNPNCLCWQNLLSMHYISDSQIWLWSELFGEIIKIFHMSERVQVICILFRTNQVIYAVWFWNDCMLYNQFTIRDLVHLSLWIFSLSVFGEFSSKDSVACLRQKCHDVETAPLALHSGSYTSLVYCAPNKITNHFIFQKNHCSF